MRKKLFSGAIWLFAFLISVFGWLYFNRRPQGGHQRAYTYNDLRRVGNALSMMVEVDRNTSLIFKNERKSVLSGKSLFRFIEQSSIAIEVIPDQRWDKEKTIVDMWGNAIHLEFENRQTNHFFKLWSNGSNQRDDDGRNDDIIYEFSIDAK